MGNKDEDEEMVNTRDDDDGDEEEEEKDKRYRCKDGKIVNMMMIKKEKRRGVKGNMTE